MSDLKSKNINEDKLLDIFEVADNILDRQEQIEKLLRDGFFQLSLARKTCPRLSILDCRFEIDPSITVCIDDSDSGLRTASLLEDKTIDNVVMFSGMPPRSLRLAQAKFLAALRKIVKLRDDAEIVLKHCAIEQSELDQLNDDLNKASIS